jgi:gamma-glutamyltranspeptidase/glutathione hydrolase
MSHSQHNLTDLRSPNLSRSLEISKAATKAAGGIVTAQNRQAAQIGADILASGGSAVDAAIATSFAIGVLEPWMSGLGGVGAMLVRPKDGPVTSIDAGARSPQALEPADFPLVAGADSDLFGWPRVAEDRNLMGAKSICIPSLLRGLEAAHRRFGRLSWAELLAPAIRLSDDGPVVDATTTAFIAQDMGRLLRNSATTAVFLPGGLPPTAAASVSGRQNRIDNPALTASLRQIAVQGVDALYNGAIGKALVADIQALGGYLSAEDLASSTAVVERWYHHRPGPAQSGQLSAPARPCSHAR